MMSKRQRVKSIYYKQPEVLRYKVSRVHIYVIDGSELQMLNNWCTPRAIAFSDPVSVHSLINQSPRPSDLHLKQPTLLLQPINLWGKLTALHKLVHTQFCSQLLCPCNVIQRCNMVSICHYLLNSSCTPQYIQSARRSKSKNKYVSVKAG